MFQLLPGVIPMMLELETASRLSWIVDAPQSVIEVHIMHMSCVQPDSCIELYLFPERYRKDTGHFFA